MAKLNDETHVLMDGAVKVYRHPNTRRWQATFATDEHLIQKVFGHNLCYQAGRPFLSNILVCNTLIGLGLAIGTLCLEHRV